MTKISNMLESFSFVFSSWKSYGNQLHKSRERREESETYSKLEIRWSIQIYVLKVRNSRRCTIVQGHLICVARRANIRDVIQS